MSDLMNLRAAAAAARSRVDRRKGERDQLQTQKERLEDSLATSREWAQTITLAMSLLREASDYARKQTMERVQELTSHGVQSVFGSGYQFRLEAAKHGEKPVVHCRVQSPYGDGDELTTEAVDSRGGGVIDTLSMALRWAMLESHLPRIDGSLFLDEPAKHVSADNVHAVAQFLKGACETFGRQVIMVTHIPHLAELADRVVQVSMVDGSSQVV